MSDTKFKTLRHIETVRNYLHAVIKEFLVRAEQHDQSKLASPEAEMFEIHTHKLRGLTYGSEAYFACLRDMGPALAHHYQHNRHHPEFHSDGYKDMNLIDLLEMLADWKAAGLRHADGDIYRSIEFNQKRFGYSDELKTILLNTVEWLNRVDVYHKAEES